MHLNRFDVNTESRRGKTYQNGGRSIKQLEHMPNKLGSKLENESLRKPFTTIDDLTEKAEELATGLRKLGKYRYPLGIRRGTRIKRKGVEKTMSDDRISEQIKGAGRTYFFDIEKTNAGKSYLRITESRKRDGESFERSSVNIFPEDAESFSEIVGKMTAKLG